MKRQNPIFLMFLFFLFLATSQAKALTPSFSTEENLAYNQFVLPVYPDGLRAPWNGLYANYLDYHANDGSAGVINKDHEVSTESTSLVALYAALRGDQATFDKMYDLWVSEDYFLTSKFHLEQWLLDSNGFKIYDNGFANASGEEVRMIEALKIASSKFVPSGGRDYKNLAQFLAEGLKGVNGGQGNFEPTSLYETTSAGGGAEIINFPVQRARYIRINCLARNTSWGYSLWEMEIYGPDTGDNNLAVNANATASSFEGAGYEAVSAVDGNFTTRWSSEFSEKQYLEIDLGSEKNIDRIVLNWETASAKSYNIVSLSNYEPKEADGYLLRPWFIWNDSDIPLSKIYDPSKIALNYNNFASYYYAANWLGDTFFNKVLVHTLQIVEDSQNTDIFSPGKGLFKTAYDIISHQYLSEYSDNACTTIAGCDIATRLGAYGHMTGDQGAINTGKFYLDFLKSKYINDGAIFASYNYNTGTPVAAYSGLAVYSFFAKLAIEYNDYDLAEKIIREQILPYQVKSSLNPGYNEGYYGAFKYPSTKYEASLDIWKDASSFINLEILLTLNKWNTAANGGWISSYPTAWTTVASVSAGNGLEDIVNFSKVSARYVRILCKKRSIPYYGYSIFSLGVFGSDLTTDLAMNKKVSVSSVEGYDLIGPKTVDNNSATRWSSEFKIDPQWIYVDLGNYYDIKTIRILWEAAYAVSYDVQVIKRPRR